MSIVVFFFPNAVLRRRPATGCFRQRGYALAVLLGLSTAGHGTESEAVPVDTVSVEQVLIHPEVSAPATVVSLADSRISTELSAVLLELPVRVGDTVAAGDLLARLDCAEFVLQGDELAARLRAAEARLEFAERQAERADALRRRRTLADETVQQRQAEAAALAAERAALRAQLAQNARRQQRCTVRAPFPALVMERFAAPGEYLSPGQPLLRLLDHQRLEVSAAVLTEDADGLARAGRLRFRHRGVDYPLALRVLTAAIDPTTRSREARLRFSAEAALVGAAGRLVFSLPAALPADYLTRRGGRLGVLLAEGDRARFLPLAGAREGRPAVLGARLSPWARLITRGRHGLDDGDLIRPTEAADD